MQVLNYERKPRTEKPLLRLLVLVFCSEELKLSFQAFAEELNERAQ